ncbi:MAG TPA: GNAT family N-acetyltransferase [Armatimonadota bacterium]|jgi:hypothetical protein
MNIMRYTDAHAFCDRVLPFLLQREAENNLMIGIILRLAERTARWGDEPPVLCAVEENGAVIAAVTQTPPFNVIITHMDAAAVTAVARQFAAEEYAFPGVLGPSAVVEGFTRAWSAITGLRAERERGMGVYQLDQVNPPPAPSGCCSVATEDDADLLLRWHREFHEEIGLPGHDVEHTVRSIIAERRYLLWRDPEPVSVAAVCGPTPHGIRTSGVFTPPSYRGRGYASANVAALSQQQLDAGRTFCYLFTNLENPISNSIYRKIGYRQVSEFTEYQFALMQE